jgi:hypothetical protein
MNFRKALILLAGSLLVAFWLPVSSASASAEATPTLPCHASMTNADPADYTRTGVHVQTAAFSGVVTVAHYRTLNRRHTGETGPAGGVTIWYSISGATPGYRVVVTVGVVHGNRSGSCTTSFLPHRL